MIFIDKNCIFYIQKLFKIFKLGKYLGRLEFRFFEEDKKLCIVIVFIEYVNRIKLIRGSYIQLLLSFCKFFKSVFIDIIVRWLKKVLANVGIDINKYGVYSIRVVFISVVKVVNVLVKIIMDVVGWVNVGIFSKFYDKLISVIESVNFGVDFLKVQC